MVFVIEFFRIRRTDDAQALVGRERVDANGLEDAIGIGRRMGLSLHMPQSPDAFAIRDQQGRPLHAELLDGSCDLATGVKGVLAHYLEVSIPERCDLEIRVWENEGGSIPLARGNPRTERGSPDDAVAKTNKRRIARISAASRLANVPGDVLAADHSKIPRTRKC
ncbi:MAG: hypothetical protein O9308_08210 [Beijerinckiaceae bacterium]|nr:hypothetical protein [Beijerinckiaceae bacterium]